MLFLWKTGHPLSSTPFSIVNRSFWRSLHLQKPAQRKFPPTFSTIKFSKVQRGNNRLRGKVSSRLGLHPIILTTVAQWRNVPSHLSYTCWVKWSEPTPFSDIQWRKAEKGGWGEGERKSECKESFFSYINIGTVCMYTFKCYISR